MTDVIVESLSAESRQKIEALAKRYPEGRQASAVLPALHVVQAQFGFIPAGPVAEVAGILGMLVSDVEQVVSFYKMYNLKPVGRYVVKICDSISCYLRGSDDLLAQGKARLGIELGETNADSLTLAKIECLAACGNAPVVQVNDEFLYNVTPEQFDEVLDTLKTAQENPYYVP